MDEKKRIKFPWWADYNHEHREYILSEDGWYWMNGREKQYMKAGDFTVVCDNFADLQKVVVPYNKYRHTIKPFLRRLYYFMTIYTIVAIVVSTSTGDDWDSFKILWSSVLMILLSFDLWNKDWFRTY